MPEKTIWLIDRLVELGLRNDVFVRLHHLGTSIEDHRRYCCEHSSFSGNTNPDVRRRLNYICTEINARGFSKPLPDSLMDTLAHEALQRYPMKGTRLNFGGEQLLPMKQHENSEKFEENPLGSHLNDKILEAYMRCFFGYGNLNANYWFIGMEEGGGNSLDEINRRLDCWNERGCNLLEDLSSYHEAFGEKQWTILRKIQPTWGRLIRILLSATGQPHEDENVRSYQVDKLGGKNGETCLMEILPLPSQSTTHWQYGEWSKLRKLQSREIYSKEYAVPRLIRIRQLIADNQPKFVVFYSLSYKEIWKNVCPNEAEFTVFNIAGFSIHIASYGGTVFVICAHPRSNGSTNTYFDAVGRKIRENLIKV